MIASAALDSTVNALAVDADATPGGLEAHVGSGMKPGAKLEIWCARERLGVLECRVLTATRLEFHARGRFLGGAFDASGKLELGPGDRCTIELGHLCDPEARCSLQHKRPILISEGFGDHAPSLRFWADQVETRGVLRCTIGESRLSFDLTIAPPRSRR